MALDETPSREHVRSGGAWPWVPSTGLCVRVCVCGAHSQLEAVECVVGRVVGQLVGAVRFVGGWA